LRRWGCPLSKSLMRTVGTFWNQLISGSQRLARCRDPTPAAAEAEASKWGRLYSRPGHQQIKLVAGPRGLASEVYIDRTQRVPQLTRCHTLRTAAVLPSEDMHDLADPVDAALGILRLAVPNASVQTFNFGDDCRLRRYPARIVGRQTCSRQLRMLQAHRDVKPI
jgi:hypothetical protein